MGVFISIGQNKGNDIENDEAVINDRLKNIALFSVCHTHNDD